MSLVAVARPSMMNPSAEEIDVDDFGVGLVDFSSDEGSLTATDLDTYTASDAETEDAPTPSSLRKRVSFGTLAEFSFSVEKGNADHFELACPLQLGGTCLRESSHSIDDYEDMRQPQRRSSDDLRTSNPTERRKIIKNSQKFEKECRKENRRKKKQHKRRISIGNGQMGRLLLNQGGRPTAELAEALNAEEEDDEDEEVGVQSERLPKRTSARPTLRRQNSIGNGQISRDKRRNRVQAFLKRMSYSKK